MLYHGATRVLVLRYSPRKMNLPLSFSDTNKFYKALPEFKEMTEAASTGQLSHFRETYIAFLKEAIRSIDNKQPRWYRKEGYWQNRMACRFGTAETPLGSELVIIDREAVLGFDTREQKRDFYGPIFDKYSGYKNEMKKLDPGEFGAPNLDNNRFGDKCDFLALDKEGNLICIELKEGSNYPGIYWGLLQTNAYGEAFTQAFTQIRRDVGELVAQKERLGLLPAGTMESLAPNGLKKVRAILAIAAPDTQHRYVWKRLARVGIQFGTSIAQEILLTGENMQLQFFDSPDQFFGVKGPE